MPSSVPFGIHRSNDGRENVEEVALRFKTRRPRPLAAVRHSSRWSYMDRLLLQPHIRWHRAKRRWRTLSGSESGVPMTPLTSGSWSRRGSFSGRHRVGIVSRSPGEWPLWRASACFSVCQHLPSPHGVLEQSPHI